MNCVTTPSHIWVCCSGSTVKSMHAYCSVLAGVCEKQGLLPKLLSPPVPKLWMGRVFTAWVLWLCFCLQCAAVYQAYRQKSCSVVFCTKWCWNFTQEICSNVGKLKVWGLGWQIGQVQSNCCDGCACLNLILCF